MTKNSHSFSHFWSFLAWFFRLFTVSDTVMLKKGAHSTWISLTHVGWWFEAILGSLSHKSMAGRHQKWPIWDQKWPNMAGLPMSRCGPKGSQMVPNGQYNMFLTIWDIFGLIWTFLDHFRQNLIFCSKLLWPRSTLCFWGEKLIFVLKGPKWCKWVQMVPNGQKHVILTIWDHLGPFWTTSGHWHACHVRPFLVPNGPFLDAPWPGMGPGEGLNGLKPPSYMYKQVTGAFRV